MVDNSPEMKNVFKKPSIVAYKRYKNLQDILVRSKLPPKRPNRVILGFGKCDSPTCTTHAFAPLGITKKHVCNYTNMSYDIISSINCQTRMSFIKSHVKSAPPLSTLEKPKDPSMSVSQSTAEMRKIKIKRNHVECTLANLDTLCKISKPLPLKKCFVKINPSSGKNESPTGSINIRQ